MVEAAAEKTAAGRGPEPWVPGPGGVRAQPHLPVFPRDTVASSGSPPPEACRKRASCVNNCSLAVAKAALDSLWPPTAAAAKALQLCPTLCDPIDGSPPGSPRPWDSPGNSTGVGCYCLLLWPPLDDRYSPHCLAVILPFFHP